MYLVAAIQKPFDVLNCLEFLHSQGRDKADVLALLIGKHANVKAARDLCDKQGITYRLLPDPDLYAITVQYLLAKRVLTGLPLLAVKAFLRIVAYLWWFVMWGVAHFLVRGIRCEAVLYDAWSSKCLYASNLSAGRHVLTDGGYATLHYGLCSAFERGGVAELVRTSLAGQKPRMPGLIREFILRRLGQDSCFFTCYFERIRPAPNLLPNEYRMSQNWASHKRVGDFALVMGIPLLKHVDEYVRQAESALVEIGIPGVRENIHYRFHPTDRNRAALDAGYKKMIEEGIQDRGVNWSYPQHSLEFDFLTIESLPKVIVSYETSSAMWLQRVFGDTIQVRTLSLR